MQRALITLAIIATTLFITVVASAFQIFEGTVRRDGTPDEAKAIVRLEGCTGFFVKNKDNKAYVATANHCAGYQMATNCNLGQVTMRAQVDETRGVCKRVVAHKKGFDTVITEVEFDNWETLLPKITFLELSAHRPRVGTKLTMIGFPADPERSSRFTTTTNCEVSSGRLIRRSDLSELDNARLGARIGPVEIEDLHKTTQEHWVGRFAARNNCSVYGGNSGGPILIEGTSVVLGMPSLYLPDVFTPQDRSLSTAMDAMSDFVRELNSELNELGISIARPYTLPRRNR